MDFLPIRSPSLPTGAAGYERDVKQRVKQNHIFYGKTERIGAQQ